MCKIHLKSSEYQRGKRIIETLVLSGITNESLHETIKLYESKALKQDTPFAQGILHGIATHYRKDTSNLQDPVVEQVRAKLLARSQKGIQKYKTTLESNPLTRLEWLRHAQEEALGLANYLQVLINKEEADQKPTSNI